MSRPVPFLLSLLFLNTGAGNGLFPPQAVPPGATPEARGLWLARQVDQRDTGRDARFVLRMRLFDRQDRQRERVLSLAVLRGGPGRPVPGDRLLIRFTYPNDIRGTGFLVWEHPDAEDERFLYLPSLGRVRRIAAAEAQESFLGSDFTFEDIGGRELDDYTYRLLDGDAAWTAADGSTHPAWRLESRHKSTDSRYPRIESLVRRDNFVVVHAAVHNRRGERQKVYDVTRLERVGGYWTTLEMVMADALQRTRTTLSVEQTEYNVGLKESDFSRRELERGGR